MPCIKTKDWLFQELGKHPELELDGEQIKDIYTNDSFGSIYFWKDVYSNISLIKVSYDAGDVLCDIREDLNLYGSEYECNVYYYEEDENIIFYDYQFDKEIKEYSLDDDLKNKNVIKMSLSDAYSYFTYQNEL